MSWCPPDGRAARAVRIACVCAAVACAAAWPAGPRAGGPWSSGAWLPVALAQPYDAVRLQIASNIGESYRAGSEADIDLRIGVHDPVGVLDRGVLFLNVVELRDDGSTPQAMHLVFESAAVTDDIFQVVWDGEALRSGMETRVRVRLRSNAPAGDYAIVVQAFRGEETGPHRVRVENRVAMQSFPFRVVR